MNNTTLNLGGSGEGFGLTMFGDHDHGTNSVGIWLTGQVRLGRSSTSSDDFNGVGVLDARLSSDDLREAKVIHEQLCSAVEKGPAGEISSLGDTFAYDVDCLQDAKLVSHAGKTSDLPKTTYYLLHRFVQKVNKSYLNDARRVVKLEARIFDAERRDGQFLISLELLNRGDYAITVPRPDFLRPFRGDKLTVEVAGQNNSPIWTINFAGERLLNEKDIPVQVSTIAGGEKIKEVEISPQSSIKFKYSAIPDVKIPLGEYEFNLIASMDADAPLVAPSLGYVDFHSDYRKPTIVRIDREYPSTPAEWKEYEARKAKEVSFLRPGATVAEAGFYRAVSVFGPRAPFLTALQAGKPAPMLDPNKWDQYEWEADLAHPVKCAPGDACPRDGRWTPRAANNLDRRAGDLIFSAHERRFRVGDKLPAVDVGNDAARSLYWEWLGA